MPEPATNPVGDDRVAARHDDGSAPSQGEWPHTCEAHPDIPAWAMCARCGQLVCRTCHRAEPDTEHALCPSCFGALTGTPGVPRHLGALPQGAQPTGDPSALADSTDPQRVADYPATARRLLLGPTAFFAGMRRSGPLKHALGFGIVCTVLGALAGLVWGALLGDAEPLLLAAQQQSGLPPWLLYVGVLFSLPLAGALQIALYALGLFAMLRLLRVRGATFTALVRVASYSMVGHLFVILPGELGAIVAIVVQVMMLQIGVRRGLGVPFDRTLIAVLVTVVVLGLLGVAAA